MKKAVWVLMLLALAGCGNSESEAKPEQQPVIEADPIKRGTIALDAVYASEQAFMQHGAASLETIIYVLQNALSMWPSGPIADEGINACYMALRVFTAHWLNVQDELNAPLDERSSDFRLSCRRAINYQLDDSRQRATWDGLRK